MLLKIDAYELKLGFAAKAARFSTYGELLGHHRHHGLCWASNIAQRSCVCRLEATAAVEVGLEPEPSRKGTTWLES